ncbi:hypothetical protein AQ802_02640 [Burkholderia pseudomallei]|nr:hypothetical protein AM256_26040 [Burkholderia pseudomallei]KEO66648.1 hypothetical protein J103_26170 [Burkholderia pseudomallei MSHR5855]ALC03085.1 hypothetical protein AM257_26080 [Burkholderia pseudomallei]ANW53531.1 hypothetical protein A7U58_26195 [Burkholderia pseudomallei]APD37369.1 hypothetical protein BK015_19160 [Burkholderia pseudomallei]
MSRFVETGLRRGGAPANAGAAGRDPPDSRSAIVQAALAAPSRAHRHGATASVTTPMATSAMLVAQAVG